MVFKCPPVFLLVAAACICVGIAAAQGVPVLTESQARYLSGEISGDAAYEHIRFTTQYHKPFGGSPGLTKVAEYVEEKAREYGLDDVRVIRQKNDQPPWHATSASLWLTAPNIRMLADLVQTPLRLADYSRSADVEAELVDVGAGLIETDYSGKDVKGKIVLAYGGAAGVMEQSVWKRGALGVICYPNPHGADYPLNALSHPEQIHWTSLRPEGPDRQVPTFAFVLSEREGRALQQVVNSSGRRATARVHVEAEFGGEPWQVMVEGYIHGTDPDNQDIVLSAHLQEEKFSANDDGSGAASTLEIARALVKLIEEGRLPKPRRNIRFWWTTEIGSERQYFADHPEQARKILLNINQDMVGANQSQDVMRVQNITRVPFSRSHFLTALAETVIGQLLRDNTPQLANLQAGTDFALNPTYAALGTRQRYNAAVIPFHNNTDHMTFTEAPVGIPGITFTNWPDNYIHTSDDDLWNIDRTQLQRNAFAVASMGYISALASDGNAPELATIALNAGMGHLAVDAAVANTLLLKADAGSLGAAYRLARNQIHQGILRERRAVESVSDVARAEASSALVHSFSETLASYESALAAALDRCVTAIAGRVPAPVLTEKETAMKSRIMRLAGGPAEFLSRREKVENVDGLHDLMGFEVLNFVDGKRSALEIYEAVQAEALHGGETYYGTVSPEKVDTYLTNLEKAGLIRPAAVGTR
jgi:hypothetical protein